MLTQKSAILGCALMFVSVCSYSADEIIFTAPPRENNNDLSANLYQPLAEYLSTLIGKKVVYRNPGNWLTYQKEMREGKYDIVFDGPHFVSWRIEHLGHELVARLPGENIFELYTPIDSKVSRAEELVGTSICSMAPPNYGTLSLLEKFRNPARQPIIRAIKGETSDVYAAYKAGKCQALVLRSTFFNKKLTDAERQQLKLIARFVSPNQGLTVGKRLDPSERKLISQQFTQESAPAPVKKLLERYGQKNDTRFILGENKDYKGQNLMLEGVAYGW